MSDKIKVLAFGEVLWDVYSDSKFIGGAPLNFAAHFVRCGGEASICSAVGADELGTVTLEQIKGLGVAADYVSVNSKPTGRCIVTLDERLVPSYKILDDVAYDYISPLAVNEKFDAFYLGTLALRTSENMSCAKKIIEANDFSEIFVDVNIRKPYISREALLFVMNKATILKISDEELVCVSELAELEGGDCEECAEEICNKFGNIKAVIITKGENGSVAYIKETKKIVNCKAEKTDVVSTVGAGDSFSAAFLIKYLQKNDVSECMKFASKISGFVVSKKEAIPKYSGEIL